jgi:flagellar protein FlbD
LRDLPPRLASPAFYSEEHDVIVLHRLGHEAEPFHLNPDMILIVEALPDTVVTFTSGAKVVVTESPERVAEEVRSYRAGILAEALRGQLRVVRAEDSRAAVDHSG